MKKRYKIFLTIIFIFTTFCLLNCGYNLVKSYPSNTVKLALSMLGCLVMLLLIISPLFYNKKSKFIIPNSMYLIFVVFCFCSIILGDVNNLYREISFYDNILHFTSGIMLAVYGFIIINTVLSKDKIILAHPLFVATFAFCFVMTLESAWEIVEYTFDDLFKTNMQVYMSDKEVYVGHKALQDTMCDFMLNASGALIVCGIGYFDLKHNRKSFSSEKLKIKNT